MIDFIFIQCNLIYIFFDRAKKANMYDIKSRRLFIKVVIGIDVDDIGNFELRGFTEISVYRWKMLES